MSPVARKCKVLTENNEDLLEKIQDYMVAGPCIVYTRKVVVDETLVRNSLKVCKLLEWALMLVRIRPSQCVAKCPLDFTRDAIWIQTLISLEPTRAKGGTLR